jgi:hypothetical protein
MTGGRLDVGRVKFAARRCAQRIVIQTVTQPKKITLVVFVDRSFRKRNIIRLGGAYNPDARAKPGRRS